MLKSECHENQQRYNNRPLYTLDYLIRFDLTFNIT